MPNGSNKLVFGNSDITENSYFELKGFILTKKSILLEIIARH